MEWVLQVLRSVLEWTLRTEVGRASALAFSLFYVLVWWRILSRAGYPGALGLLMLIPPVGVGVWAFLAFAPWPARRELTALRKVQRVMHQTERRRLVA